MTTPMLAQVEQPLSWSDKRWKNLEAAAALAGYIARRYYLQDGREQYSISRWNWPPRIFTTIGGAESFMKRAVGT